MYSVPLLAVTTPPQWRRGRLYRVAAITQAALYGAGAAGLAGRRARSRLLEGHRDLLVAEEWSPSSRQFVSGSRDQPQGLQLPEQALKEAGWDQRSAFEASSAAVTRI